MLDVRTDTTQLEVYRVSDTGTERIARDLLVCETEVVIKLGNKTYKRLFCLPSHLEELAIGYLVSEGIGVFSSISKLDIQKQQDVFVILIQLPGLLPELKRTKPGRVTLEMKMTSVEVWEAVKKLDENSFLFKETGGTHVVGVCNRGNSVFVEDISRHCAVDKAIGLAIRSGLNPSQSALVTSCRQTMSTIIKSINVGFPIVISISAVTDLAVAKAIESNITLIGFARKHDFNIYSHPWRITRD